jgi:polyhydroxyalkanoate synthesis regulator protein
MNKQLEVRIAPSRNLRIIGSAQSHTTLKELHTLIREGYDIEFSKGKEDMTAKYHLHIIKEQEALNPATDKEFLNRIIRAGGLLEYTRRLENE